MAIQQEFKIIQKANQNYRIFLCFAHIFIYSNCLNTSYNNQIISGLIREIIIVSSNRNDDIYKDYECFNHLVDEVTEEIFSLLKNPENMPEYMMDRQLRSILEELGTMKCSLRHYDFHPYYPKGIADCWMPDDPLGNKLMDVLDVYNKIKRL